MKLNNIDFTLLSYNDIKSLIYKYNIGRYGKRVSTLNPPKDELLKDISIFIKNKISKYKQRPPSPRINSISEQNSHKKILLTEEPGFVQGKQRRNSAPLINIDYYFLRDLRPL
jgi:hypothetical protein